MIPACVLVVDDNPDVLVVLATPADVVPGSSNFGSTGRPTQPQPSQIANQHRVDDVCARSTLASARATLRSRVPTFGADDQFDV